MNAVLKEPELRIAYDGCPLCGGDSDIRRKDKCEPRNGIHADITWMECLSCEHVYASHYFNESGLAQLLSKVNAEGYFGGNLDAQREIWSHVIGRILPHLESTDGLWIDVGVGNGAFLFTAAEYGFDAVGIDKRHYLLSELKDYGYNVEHADAVSYDYSNARVVILADILEHVPYPKELLLRIREKLDGALFVSCPNMDSVSWKYLERRGDNPYWIELEHYHNFTRTRLEALLKECGFTPVNYGISPRYTGCMEIIAV